MMTRRYRRRPRRWRLGTPTQWLVAFPVLFGVAAVAQYWWLFLPLGLATAGVQLAWRIRLDERERCAQLAARADEQHRWEMEGDPRGTFGSAYACERCGWPWHAGPCHAGGVREGSAAVLSRHHEYRNWSNARRQHHAYWTSGPGSRRL